MLVFHLAYVHTFCFSDFPGARLPPAGGGAGRRAATGAYHINSPISQAITHMNRQETTCQQHAMQRERERERAGVLNRHPVDGLERRRRAPAMHDELRHLDGHHLPRAHAGHA